MTTILRHIPANTNWEIPFPAFSVETTIVFGFEFDAVSYGSSGNQIQNGICHRIPNILAGLHHLIYSLCPCHDRVAHYTDFSGQVGIAPVAVAIERWASRCRVSATRLSVVKQGHHPGHFCSDTAR